MIFEESGPSIMIFENEKTKVIIYDKAQKNALYVILGNCIIYKKFK